MIDYTEQARFLSLRMFISAAAAGQSISQTTQKVRETEEAIRRSDRLIASIAEVYRGFGKPRPRVP